MPVTQVSGEPVRDDRKKKQTSWPVAPSLPPLGSSHSKHHFLCRTSGWKGARKRRGVVLAGDVPPDTTLQQNPPLSAASGTCHAVHCASLPWLHASVHKICCSENFLTGATFAVPPWLPLHPMAILPQPYACHTAFTNDIDEQDDMTI